MGAVGQGFLSLFQFGREAAWGTAVAATKRLPVNRIDPRAEIGRVRPRALDGTLVQPPVQAAGIRGMATVEFPVTYSGLLTLWDCLMGTGTYGSNGGATTGSSPYTHTWTGFLRYMNSLTLQMGMGDIPTTVCERLIGAKITKATIKGSAGLTPADAILTCTLELVGKTLATGITPTAGLASVATDYVLFTHNQAMSDSQGTVIQMTDFELTIDTGASDDRWYMGLAGAIAEPLRRRRPTCRLAITSEFSNKNALDDFIANTKDGALTLDFVSGSKQFQWTLASVAQMDPIRHPTEGDKFLTQRVVYEAEDDGSGGTVQLVCVNTQATITT